MGGTESQQAAGGFFGAARGRSGRVRILPALIAVASLLPATAGADTLDTVNWARLRGCSAPAGRTALRSDPKLQLAAGRLAGGSTLHDALAASGYVGADFSAVHLSGAMTDAQIAHTLTTSYCRTLINPKLQDIGVQRRGGEIWMVLAVPTAMPASADAAGVSQRILGLVNGARATGRHCGSTYFGPARPWVLNSSLTAAALAHSKDMAQSLLFDHRGRDGSTPAQRVERAGYGAHRIVGENIAAGAMSPTEVTAGWLASPAHCENIMDRRFTQIGIGYAASPHSDVGMYWTQDFAAPR